MAKRKTFNGTTYYPRKNIFDVSCQICRQRIIPPVGAYSIGSKCSEQYACARCLNQMHLAEQKQLQRNIFDFPEEATLYIGRPGLHKCSDDSAVFSRCLASFRYGKTTIAVQLLKCAKCGCFILESKPYEKNQQIFRNYKLIKLKTGKEIVVPISTGKVGGTQKIVAQPVPSSVQQAAFRPFQGGRFSGK